MKKIFLILLVGMVVFISTSSFYVKLDNIKVDEDLNETKPNIDDDNKEITNLENQNETNTEADFNKEITTEPNFKDTVNNNKNNVSSNKTNNNSNSNNNSKTNINTNTTTNIPITNTNDNQHAEKENTTTPSNSSEEVKSAPEIDPEYEKLKKLAVFKDHSTCNSKSNELAFEYSQKYKEKFRNTSCMSVAYKGELLGYKLVIFFTDGSSEYYTE